MRTATRAAEVILRAYPQAEGRANEAQAAELVQFLATLTTQELDWVMDPRHGIKARCRFMPLPADVNELVAERHKARVAIGLTNGTSGYRKLTSGEAENIERPSDERRKEQVKDLLGYDPLAPVEPTRREKLTPPTAEDFELLRTKLKTPPPSISDATPQLRKLLREQQESRT